MKKPLSFLLALAMMFAVAVPVAAEEERAVMPINFSDEDFPEQFGLTKDEFMFILDTAPEFDEEDPFTREQLSGMFVQLAAFYTITSFMPDGIIAHQGGDFDLPYVYDRADVNRLFSVLMEEAFTPENDGEYGYVAVTEDTVSIYPATPGASSAEIIDIALQGRDMVIYYDVTAYQGSDGPAETFPRVATLSQTKEGAYRITSIQPRTEAAGETPLSDDWQSIYTAIIETNAEEGIGEYTLFDMDGDEIPELIMCGTSTFGGPWYLFYSPATPDADAPLYDYEGSLRSSLDYTMDGIGLCFIEASAGGFLGVYDLALTDGEIVLTTAYEGMWDDSLFGDIYLKWTPAVDLSPLKSYGQ